jgi:hypothetical protein
MTPIHLRENYYGIEIEKGSSDFRKDGNKYDSIITYYCKGKLITYFLPPGSWQIICLSGECSEEVAKGIVEPEDDGYKDYDFNNFHHDIPFTYAKQSLESLLSAKGMNEKNTLILKQLSNG